MNGINSVSNEVNETLESELNKCRKFSNLGAISNNCEDDETDLSAYSNKVLPGKSRYGRTIKPKSPKTEIVSTPKARLAPSDNRTHSFSYNSNVNSKMTKDQKFDNIGESNNDLTEDNNVVNDVDDTTDSLNSLSTSEETISKLLDPPEGCSWVLGQLAWARVGNFPFWPCVVTIDPLLMVYHKLKATGRSQMLMIHVQYFGDKERHSWVSSNSMIPFKGPADFKKLSESITAEVRKKDPKYASGFIVKPSIKSKWESAIEEAMELQSMSNDERASIFKPKEKTSSPKTLDEKFKTNKRKQSNDSNGSDLKRAKQDNVDELYKSQCKTEGAKAKPLKYVENGRNHTKLNSDTPPLSPLSQKSSGDECSTLQKVDFKSEQDVDGVFDVYYERNRDILKDEYPDASEDDIRKYLKKTWDTMSSAFRKKYRVYVASDASSVQTSENLSDREDDLIAEIDGNTKDNKKSKAKTEKDEMLISETKRTRPYNLFRGMKQEKVCQICEKSGKLTRCKGPCYSYFHLSCVKPGESSPEHSIDENTIDDKIFDNLKEIKQYNADNDANNGKTEEQDELFKCIDCLSGVAPACFICNERERDRIRCSVLACGKHYHSSCLKSWPQSHWQGGRLTCPYHMCHTCSSDNPQDSHSRAPNEKLARCVRCPSSYHTSTSCLPAGSVILTGNQIVCPKHYQPPHPPVNAAWCFLCTRGGSLICCDTCPTSFHLECLGIDAPDGAFICEDCETGRLPLYGEIVWVKLGNYRWWPSRICYPQEIPENIEAIPHSPGKFCVMFLGSNNYYWIHRGRAFLYQDGDANIKPPIGKKNNRDDNYRKALEQANEIHIRLKAERAAAKDHHGSRGLKPPPYVKLKVNKPVGNVKPAEVESIVACDCDAEWSNPCAPGTDCLNRILLVECSPGICPAGSKCNNQAFVRRQYPAMEPFHTVGRGWGLRSLEPIKAGQFVIEYVGEIIDEAEYKRRLHRKKELKNENFYFLTIDNNRMIDAEPKGNLSRFMNHSCSPNCETQKWTVNGDTRIGLFALCDIEPGEELTFNYNLACDGETRKACLCGAPNCSGFIGLKVQKPQVTTPSIQQKKFEKIYKMKRQRKLRKKELCWSCGQEIDKLGDYVICDQKTCGKKYHTECVTIDDVDTRFSCPWHHCASCGRRTSAHCSFCSAAFCQLHLDGNLSEYGDKGSLVCKHHESTDMQASVMEDDKDYSDNGTETDRDYSSTGSNSPLTTMEKSVPREPSPRVSIIEVHPSSEESEGSQKEDDEETLESIDPDLCEYSLMHTKRKSFHRLSVKLKEGRKRVEQLCNLTSSQLESIIGGSLCEQTIVNTD